MSTAADPETSFLPTCSHDRLLELRLSALVLSRKNVKRRNFSSLSNLATCLQYANCLVVKERERKRERERQRQRDRDRDRVEKGQCLFVFVFVCMSERFPFQVGK